MRVQNKKKKKKCRLHNWRELCLVVGSKSGDEGVYIAIECERAIKRVGPGASMEKTIKTESGIVSSLQRYCVELHCSD